MSDDSNFLLLSVLVNICQDQANWIKLTGNVNIYPILILRQRI